MMMMNFTAERDMKRKQSLQNDCYCMYEMVDIGEDPFLFSSQLHPLDFSDCSSFGSSPYMWEPLLKDGLHEAVVLPFMNSSMDEDDFPSQLNQIQGSMMSSSGWEKEFGGLNEMRIGLEAEKQQIVMHENGEGMISSSSSSISSIGSDYVESMTKLKRVKKKQREGCRSMSGSTTSSSSESLSRTTISRYFYMPITQAAKELKVGLTLLKKRCRELGIPRWPHRKLMSLQTLINNVQEMGEGEGIGRDMKIRDALRLLEEQRKLMEEMPEVDLEEKTKKLRQACFKANYKKRKLMMLEWHRSPISQTSCEASFA